jgi:L-threonylcarbamoyladenylate synthase
MKTELLSIKNQSDIEKAIKYIQEGKLIAIPTETVYGLAADAKNETAIQNIFIAKGRPNNHPLIVHIDSIENIKNWADDIPQQAYILAQHFWPGPLTLLLKKKKTVSNLITGGLDTIAIRIPNNDTLRMMIAKLNTGLVAPSANPHTKLSPTSAQQVFDSLQGKISAVLDGGQCELGIESTIVSLLDDTPKILRQGPITATMLASALGSQVETFEKHSTKVPGNMLKHYQPHTKSILMDGQEIVAYLQEPNNLSKKIGYMYYSNIAQLASNGTAIKISCDPKIYGSQMYQTLYKLDKFGYDEILIETPPKTEEWSAILDRLEKACY